MPSIRLRRLLNWWTDDPANRGRATLANPAVQRLAAEIAPGSHLTDLGGTMSLNVRLEPAGLVLRVHEPFESRQRLLTVQAVRCELARQGLAVPAPRLPRRLVHGDVRLGNICRSPTGDTVYLDFGFLADRPRIHELAYSLAFMVLALNGENAPAQFAWTSIAQRVEDYESTAAAPLTVLERKALPSYAAAVPLYIAATAGLTADPAGQLRERLPFLHMSEWLLAHPQMMVGD